jgi:hypothetical protein
VHPALDPPEILMVNVSLFHAKYEVLVMAGHEVQA